MSKLWVYNLHYFDDLGALGSSAHRKWHEDLLVRWVAENPPALGDGWEPYPVSRRLVNCVKWSAMGNELPAPMHASLAVQARWLDGRLEYHLLGNHLFANAKALVHAGLYFDGAESNRWFSRGMSILEREVREQVLPDGGHFELSPMYHCSILEDLLDLINLLRAHGRSPPTNWTERAADMLCWLHFMSHPDGEIAFFNDAAFGIAPEPNDLAAYASRLGIPIRAPAEEPLVLLSDSGYARLRAGQAHLICDCARVGPDYMPGHAHADTLSFELSLAGQRLFVNSGTSRYGADEERKRQRGTAAHNTVVVDGVDSSEMWAAFRVARRARPRIHAAATTSDSVAIEASHNGYRRLRGRNEHRRRWRLDEHSLCIEDEVTGRYALAGAYFHVHPDVKIMRCGEHEVRLSLKSGEPIAVTIENAAALEIERGTWHPRFGAAVPNHRIVAHFRGAKLITRVQWH